MLQCTAKLTLFTVSKDEWNTKEDTGKLMRMYCMHYGMPKGTTQSKASKTI